MLAGKPIPQISAKFGIPATSLYNYSKSRLKRYRAGGDPVLEQERKDLERQEVAAVRDCVMEDVNKTRETGWKLVQAMLKGLPENGVLDCDPKGAASLLREIRGNAELQARMEGRIQDGKSSVQVNVVVLGGHTSRAASLETLPELEAIAGEVIDAEGFEIPPGS
jgi:hypothetical protein